MKTIVTGIKNNFLGAAIGGIGGYLIGRKFLPGTLGTVGAVIFGVIAGAYVQGKIIPSSGIGKTKIVVKQDDATK